MNTLLSGNRNMLFIDSLLMSRDVAPRFVGLNASYFYLYVFSNAPMYNSLDE